MRDLACACNMWHKGWLLSAHRGGVDRGCGIANALLQLVSNPLAFCLDRRHSIEKPSDVTGKISVTVLCKVVGESSPAPFNLAACFHKRSFAGIGMAVPFEQVGCIC